jgi:hypothetical protein
MHYLIMKAIGHENGAVPLTNVDDPSDEAVGVLRLCYEKVNTLWQVARTTKQKLYIRGASLEKSVYVGPDLLGLTSLSKLSLTTEQQQHFNKNGWVVVMLETDPLVYQSDNETIHITASDGSLYWRCAGTRKIAPGAGEYLGTFSVCGLPFTKWKPLLEFIKDEAIAEARKQPLTWEEAWGMILRFGTNGVLIASQAKNKSDLSLLATAIDATLEGAIDGKLSHVDCARLECTLAAINGLL